jgi:plastocyanin
MKFPRVMTALALAAVAATVTASNELFTVPVSFGRGLDTAQPGNAVNHVVLPNEIKVAEGGVVHFLVAGLHQIFVYEQGKEVEDVILPPAGQMPPPAFINDLNGLRYQGINPAGGPLGTPASANPSNAVNRIESVSFREPGTYLVICNVRQHFLDGMHAVVRVQPRGPNN